LPKTPTWAIVASSNHRESEEYRQATTSRAREMSEKMNFGRVMAAMALRYKDNLAIVNVERNRRYTFPAYHQLTNRIANMCRDRLGLSRGDTVYLILDNDNLSLLHFPVVYKQDAAFIFGNLRDGPEESIRQIDYVRPKVVFIETRLIDAYYDSLKGPRLLDRRDGSRA
jgi:acyl-CoA synthetase (AMP-forming)/AMP-acid ligase II